MAEPGPRRLTAAVLGTWLTLTAVVLGMAGGWHDWYAVAPWYDKVVHFSASVGLGLLALFGIKRLFPLAHASLWQVLLAASAALVIGGLWEVTEWFHDLVAHENMVLGAHDTLIDMAADAGGALVGAAVGVALPVRRHHRSSPLAASSSPSACR